MFLSKTCVIAIKATVYIASNSKSGKKVNIKEISEMIDESEHTLSKILQILTKREIINSIKGVNGGFYMSEKQMNTVTIEIIYIFEGNDIFNKCALGLSNCSKNKPCPFHDEYAIIRDQIKTTFKNKKIIDLCVTLNQGLTFLLN